MLATLDLQHSAWASPVRRVMDALDAVLELTPGGSTATFVADVGLIVGTAAIDDSGRAIVPLQIGDEDRALRGLINSVRDSAERVAVRLRWYDDDGTLLLGPALLYLHEPQIEGPVITAEARSRNDNDLAAQPTVTTLENTPMLRGL